MNLKDKVILITGGARMGETLGRAFGARGAMILLSYRASRASAQASVDALTKNGIHADSVRCDFSKPADIEALAKDIQAKFGRLDVVLHMASIYESHDLFAGDTLTAWQANMDAHVNSAFALARALTPLLRRDKQGRFIFMVDWTVDSGRPRYKGFTPYYVSKAALQGFVQALALEVAPDVLVNAIAPGPILPPPGMSEEERRAVEDATPLKRWGGPEEIAKAALFLAETDFVTGETIRVDGGRHLY